MMCNSAMDCHGEESWDMALKMLADLPLADATGTATRGWEFCGWGVPELDMHLARIILSV